MNLDEAIAREEALAYSFGERWKRLGEKIEDLPILEEEHRQMAEWLRELKDYRERIPSYEAGYNDAKREIALSGEYERAYQRGYMKAMEYCTNKLMDVNKQTEVNVDD